MADCCEPGCSDEVLCPVHQALADLRDRVKALAGVAYVRGHTTVWLHEVLALIEIEEASDE